MDKKIECQACLAVDGDARFGRCAAAQKAVADASPGFVLPRRSVHAPLCPSVFTPESPCFDFLSLFRDEIVRLAPFWKMAPETPKGCASRSSTTRWLSASTCASSRRPSSSPATRPREWKGFHCRKRRGPQEHRAFDSEDWSLRRSGGWPWIHALCLSPRHMTAIRQGWPSLTLPGAGAIFRNL